MPVPLPNPTFVAISPDRAELLVLGYETMEPKAQLWVVPLLGGTPRRLGDVRAHDATWSPDGERVVYVNGQALYQVNSDGTESRKLTDLPDFPFLWPRFSPDGQVLRLTLSDEKAGSKSQWEILPDGSQLHRFLPGWNDPPNEGCGVWTPDGRYFVFQARRPASSNSISGPSGKEAACLKESAQSRSG